jgi:hypothetical protein
MLRGLIVFLVFIAATLSVADTNPAGDAPALQSVTGARSAIAATTEAPAAQTPAVKAPVDQLIPWLLDEDRQLRGIPFSEVIVDVTGRKVLAFDPKNEIDRRVIKQISAVLDEVMRRMNAPDSPIQNIARINEVSSHFEDMIRELLNAAPGFSCDFPRTAEGRVQRSGYPDLRVVDLASDRVFYLDPKLYAGDSRDSSFRTFYFEPKIATNKVRDDAVHFIVGFEHQPTQGYGSAGQPSPGPGLAGEPRDVAASLSRGAPDEPQNTATERRGHNANKSGRWKFTRWDLVDLARFKVKLKAEFQGSNHDLYRPEAVVATSAK